MGSFLDTLSIISDLLSISGSNSRKRKVKDTPEVKPDLSKKISIIMPVYNGEKYLETAIDSIRNQSYKNWELIFVNDGSTDNTEKIIGQYADDRLKYIKNETNLGLIATLNKAINFCKGDYIARMDADDICEKDRLAKQVRFLEKHPTIAMCGTNAIVIDENGIKKGDIVNVLSNDYIQINLLFSVPIVHPSVMLRSQVLKNYRYDENYKHIEDYELWCRIADDQKICNLAAKLLEYRWHTTNVSIQNNNTQEELKNKVITNQLNKIGLDPNQEELYLHRVSFMQYDAKETLDQKPFDKYNELSLWFSKLIDANKKKKRYNQNKFVGFLWSRWIVVCIKQKQYSKIFKASFVPYNLSVYIETIKLMAILMRK